MLDFCRPGDFLSTGRTSYSYEGQNRFSASDLTFDLAAVVVDNNDVSADKGFILYVEIDDNNNPSDNFGVQALNRAILVTIVDDDGESIPL